MKYLALFFFLFLNLNTQAQNDPNRPESPEFIGVINFYDEKDKVGLIDGFGTIILQPTYDDISMNRQWDGHYAPFRQAGHWGFIDRRVGKVLIPAQFTNVRYFKDGLAAVEFDNGKWGFIDMTGRVVIQPQWDQAYDFHAGMAKVVILENPQDERMKAIVLPQIMGGPFMTPGKTGFINQAGKYVIPVEFSHIDEFQTDTPYARFTRGKYKCDDPNGYCWNSYPDSKWGIIDCYGNIVIEDNEYDYIEYAHYGNVSDRSGFVVQKNGQYGFLAENLSLLFPLGSFEDVEGLMELLKKL